jgi:glycosyltransferase involved in cell wall biosynthesis
MNTLPEPTVALLPCGNPFEDFFDTINVSFETFRTDYTGSWMFAYAEALRAVGVRTVLFFISGRTSTPLRFIHEPSGTSVCILPTPSIHRTFRSLKHLGAIPNCSFTRSFDSYLLLPINHLTQELQREQCNAILFQDYENPSYDVCVWLSQRMKLPVFATFQGGNSHRSKLEQFTRPVALRASTGLIIASKVELQRVSDRYQLPPSKLKHIFNPVDVTAWNAVDREQARKELGIPVNAKVVVFHGRIDIQHKGLDILLQAWDLICQKRSDVELRLLLVGTGQDAATLQHLIETMKLRGVMWLNEFVSSRTTLQTYLSAATVYTLPSRIEGFPVAPVEAMSCNLPVVATDVPGIGEILEFGEASGGIIVPKEDPMALATALGQFLDNEAWAEKLGVLARSRVEKGFSLESIGSQLRNSIIND